MSKSELVDVKSVPVDLVLCISRVENVTLFVLEVVFLLLFLFCRSDQSNLRR